MENSKITFSQIAYPYEDLESGMTEKTLDTFKNLVEEIIKSPLLLVDQKRDSLVDAAFKTLPYPPISSQARSAIEAGVICLLNEGPAPYHPRYAAPDFGKVLAKGSEFFGLKPAKDLYEAITSLLTVYKYSPTAGLPPFIGRLDDLLEPYVESMPEEQAIQVLRSFWILVDRLHPNAFVHANLGPLKSRTGQMLLDIDLQVRSITNLSLRYDPKITERDFALQAVRNTLELTKPYFVNHPLNADVWGEDYVIASCYNPMLNKGGIYTLVRLNLKQLLAEVESSLEVILNEVIPEIAILQMEIVNSRIRYLVEETHWFERNIFVQEGLLDPNRFSAYAAVVGLYDAVNDLMGKHGRPEARFGHDEEANQVAYQLVRRLRSELLSIPALYCEGTNGHASFHAQVGISTDEGITPGVRIPAGEEPPLYEHLNVASRIHELVDGGVSTIIEFDQTAKGNPDAVLDIIDGAMETGIRDLSVGSSDSEYVRVSGYLVKRSDIELAKEERRLRHISSHLGVQFMDNQPNTLHRRERAV
jgi:YjjI family glycine radical enzyme